MFTKKKMTESLGAVSQSGKPPSCVVKHTLIHTVNKAGAGQECLWVDYSRPQIDWFIWGNQSLIPVGKTCNYTCSRNSRLICRRLCKVKNIVNVLSLHLSLRFASASNPSAAGSVSAPGVVTQNCGQRFPPETGWILCNKKAVIKRSELHAGLCDSAVSGVISRSLTSVKWSHTDKVRAS